jgi:hypothetical protein
VRGGKVSCSEREGDNIIFRPKYREGNEREEEARDVLN